MISKKRYNFLFWSISVSFALGIFLFSIKGVSIPVLFLLAFVLFAVIVFFKNKLNPAFFTIIVCFLFLLFGGLRYQLAIPKNQKDHLINHKNIALVNQVVFTISKTFKNTAKWRNYQATVKQVNGKKTSGNLLLKIKKDSALLQKGASYVGNLKLIPLPTETFPYGFNYTQYLNKQGITHQSWVTKTKLIPLPKYDNKLIRFIVRFQQQLNKRLQKQSLSSEVIQFTQALVLGNKKALTKQLKTNFQNAGVIHILAISGLHIGVVYFIFGWLLKKIMYKHQYRILRSIIVLVLVWLFTWFTGASDSALRATTMFSFFEISQWLLRRQHPLNALLLSVFVLLLINPMTIFSVGLQLSVTAVASIIIGVPKLSQVWEPKYIITNYLWKITCVSLCAQIGLLPLSVYYFHQFPLLFLVANIPIMCFIPVIMGLAVIMVAGSSFYIWPKAVDVFYDSVITIMLHFVNWVASIDSLIVKELYISKLTVLAIYTGFLYLRWCYSNTKNGLKYLAVPIAFLGIVGFTEIHQRVVKREVWLLNDYTNTTIVDLFSNGVQVYSQNELKDNEKQYKIRPIATALHHNNITYNSLQQVYNIKGKKVLIVSGNYLPKPKSTIDILLVSNSPKINFERLLKEIQPKKVIFAANNTFYHITNWKMGCEKLGVSYYDVSKQGSLRLDRL